MAARARPASPDPAAFRRTILRWFEAHARDLPWRRTRDPWQVLVSEIMLQQTQVDRVVPKYLTFVRRWATPAAFARAPLGDVLAAWSGLGYNRRAKHLHDAAKAIVAAGGVMPTTVEALEALPGVGRYTARAVASFAHNADVSLWDTNVRRIALRVFFGGEFSRRAVGDEELAAILDRALPRGRSRDWHNALMDFGSAVCVSRSPLCASCPVRRTCIAAPRFLAGAAPGRALVRPQAKFEGSRRQGRGKALKFLAGAAAPVAERALREAIGRDDAAAIVRALLEEGLIVRRPSGISLP